MSHFQFVVGGHWPHTFFPLHEKLRSDTASLILAQGQKCSATSPSPDVSCNTVLREKKLLSSPGSEPLFSVVAGHLGVLLSFRVLVSPPHTQQTQQPGMRVLLNKCFLIALTWDQRWNSYLSPHWYSLSQCVQEPLSGVGIGNRYSESQKSILL